MGAIEPEPRPGHAPGNVYAPRLARVLGVREEIAARGVSKPVVTLSLERDGMDFRPGQFVEAGIFGAGEVPISISAAAGLEGALYLTIRAAGVVSTLLTRRRPGDIVSVRGPMGNGFPLEQYEGQDLVFIAGGIGLAPLRGLLWEILLHRERYGRIVLLHGARTPHDLLYPWQWADWTKLGVEMQLSVDVGDGEWEKHNDPPRIVGFLTALFPALRMDPARTYYFLCGPPVMIRIACGELARKHDVPHDRLVSTLERHMKCGIGKCGHCVVVDRYVCMDGPVFSYDQLLAMDRIEPPW